MKFLHCRTLKCHLRGRSTQLEVDDYTAHNYSDFDNAFKLNEGLPETKPQSLLLSQSLKKNHKKIESTAIKNQLTDLHQRIDTLNSENELFWRELSDRKYLAFRCFYFCPATLACNPTNLFRHLQQLRITRTTTKLLETPAQCCCLSPVLIFGTDRRERLYQQLHFGKKSFASPFGKTIRASYMPQYVPQMCLIYNMCLS